MIGPAGFMQAPKAVDASDVDRPMAPRQAEAERRNEAVRAVLLAATEPLGPTEIGKLVNKIWSCFEVGQTVGYYGISSAITPICRRIGAVSIKGKWYLEKTA